MLNWIQQWFLSQCNGDWEHEYGVKIGTLDNPGWSIHIDLAYTELEDVRIDIPKIENSPEDWYSITVVDAVFNSFCDPTKLDFILSEFKNLVELGETKFAAARPQARIIPFSEGYSLNKGLPGPARRALYNTIDRELISSINMHEKGHFLADAIQPVIEELLDRPVTDKDQLISLVYKYSWEYIYSKNLN
jgi:hypothetical protein